MRSIGKNGFDYQPIAMHIISTNQLPQLPKVDEAIKRRMMVVPFNNTVTENNVIVDFEKQLYAANGEGLLLRAVQGYQRVLDRGGKFYVPDIVRRATDAWLRPYDGVRLFAAECVEEVADSTARISATEMHERCCAFCIDRGLHMPTSPKDMHMQLAELGFQSGKSSNTYWYGVRFKDTGR
jgi:phage/plasmid-associated DNA primase